MFELPAPISKVAMLGCCHDVVNFWFHQPYQQNGNAAVCDHCQATANTISDAYVDEPNPIVWICLGQAPAVFEIAMCKMATFITEKKWACPKCTFHNHQQSWECWSCKEPKPYREEWWELTDAGVWRRMPMNDEDDEPPAASSVQPKKAKDAASRVQPKSTRRPKNKKEEKEMAKEKVAGIGGQPCS